MIEREPWSDDRLTSAFAARATAGPAATPAGLLDTTLAAVRAAAAPRGLWARLSRPVLLAAGAVIALVVVVGAVALGPRLLNDVGRSGSVEFRNGPTPDLHTLDAGEFTFDYPAEWLAYDVTGSSSSHTSIAVLGTSALEAKCGTDVEADIACVIDQPLADGETVVVVGTEEFMGGSLADRPNIEIGSTTRSTIDGYLAILEDVVPDPSSPYGADLTLHQYIARPSGPSHVVKIDVLSRGSPDELDAVRATFDQMMASFRYSDEVKAAAASASPLPSASATPTASDGAAAIPTTAFGLPVIDVEAATAVRDAGDDDRELAVRGWFPTTPTDCLLRGITHTSPIQPRCPDQMVLLMAEPEVLTRVEADGFVDPVPSGPAFQIDLDGLDPSWQPARPIVLDGPGTPVDIVAIGHFDDRRASACPADEQQACRDRFVVDRVDRVDGEVQPTSFLNEMGGGHVSTIDDVVALVATRTGSATSVLSVSLVDGRTVTETLEPHLHFTCAGASSCMPPSAVWLIRVLDEGVTRTMAVGDGVDDVLEVTAFGTVELPPLGTPLPSPIESPALEDGHLAVVGVDGVPGEMRCGNFRFPFAGLASPTGAERRVGPEFEALRRVIEDPPYADGFDWMIGWQEAGRTSDQVVFLGTKPPNGDEGHWVVLPVDRDGPDWRFLGTGGDCQPAAVLPAGFETATWVLDPAFPPPESATQTLHLLVTETACASGAPADDRLSPAYVVADPYRIEISIGVQLRAGGQDCQGNPPTAVRIDLPEPLGARPLVDPFAPPPPGSSG